MSSFIEKHGLMAVCLGAGLAISGPAGGGRGMVVGGLTRENAAQPGEKYQGTIVLKNSAEEPQELKVYQSDYLFFCDGTTQYGEPGKLKRSNADWVSFGPSWLTIPAKGTSIVNYAVEVPKDESLRGTYWSMLMVELVGKESPESVLQPAENKSQLGVRQVVRYGIQMVTNIGDTGNPKPRFVETKLEAKEGGGRELLVDLVNDGDLWMRPLVWVELFDEAGRSVGKFEGGTMRVYPGTSVRYRIDLSDVPEGTYKALVVGDAGGERVFGARHTLKIQKQE